VESIKLTLTGSDFLFFIKLMQKKFWYVGPSYEGLFPVRYLVAFFGFMGFAFNYMLRVNFNFTIVSMVNFYANSSTANETSDCGFIENTINSTVTNEVTFFTQ